MFAGSSLLDVYRHLVNVCSVIVTRRVQAPGKCLQCQSLLDVYRHLGKCLQCRRY